MTTSIDTGPRAPWAGRVTATLAALCFALHVALLWTSSEHAMLMTAAMVMLSGACVACAPRLWHGPKARDWIAAAVLSSAMVALHLITMAAGGHAQHSLGNGYETTVVTAKAVASHEHMAANPSAATVEPTPGHVFMTGASLLAVSQAFIANAVLVAVAVRRLSRRRPATF